ncbi:MAG: DUF5615 family PIN-like protein, partial [Candidatus Sumerlaeaceae bacterium]|nr:DUF5615 family PIN-like protein [Candidatus Sumerlaeaceae bacterium]
MADENLDRLIVDWLRVSGHDVSWAAEDAISAPDDELLAKANAENRILVTKDKDFCELVYRKRLASTGIILLRIKALLQTDKLQVLQRHWPVV